MSPVDTGLDDKAISLSDQTMTVARWKAVEYAGLVLFTVLAPRFMGPERYGRFAAVVSLVTVLVIASGLGGLATFGRFMPQYTAVGDWPRARSLFVQLFWTRAGVALLLSFGLVLGFPVLVAGGSRSTSLAAAGALLAGATASTCFQLFYGLNSLGRWSLQDALTRPVLLALLGLLGGLQDLERGVFALLLTQLLFLLVGLIWTWPYFRQQRSPFDWPELVAHLRFGFLFFVGNLLLVAVWRSGEVLVLSLSGRADETAYFSIANAVVMAAGLLLIQAAVMAVPSMTALHVADKHDEVADLTGQLLRFLVLGSVVAVVVAYTVGPWAVDAALGAHYRPVVNNLRLMVLGVPATAILAVGLGRALVEKRPGVLMLLNGIAAATFAITSIVLVPRLAALGASLAIAVAFTAAAVASVFCFRLAPALTEARTLRLLTAAAISLSITLFPVGSAGLRSAVAAGSFALLLIGLRVVSREEYRYLWQKVKGAA